MRILQDLGQTDRTKLRDELKDKFRSNSMNLDNFGTHFESVLSGVHCYKINLFAADYKKIWIYSCIRGLSSHPNQQLSEVINYIASYPDILSLPHPMFLKIPQVHYYLKVLSQCQNSLMDCFPKLGDGDCFLLEDEIVKVTDGMHRLVAYGLASHMNEDCFPIQAYLGTVKTVEEVEAI